ncbi:MAG: 50S ribosomal protein L21 [Anaerolineaceae bacterium]|nr:MAG: 50S ribosomal protein L21 [Anaerolineaceae bacterium]
MRFAIVESGGKQYRAVEGATIDVDRLSHEVGKTFDFERVLLMADGDDAVMVGTPAIDGIKVSATVIEHIKGPKVVSFKYRPKKRIRVKGGHRQQYTRLMIDFIGKPGEERKAKKEAKPAVEKAEAKEEVKVEKPSAEQGRSEAKAKKEATASSSKEKKTEKKAPAKKPVSKSSTTKKTEKK